MKQEGWRTLRSLQAASAPPEVAAAPATGSGARAVPVGQRLVSGMWHYLVGVRSTLAHVEWSVSFIGVLIYLFATTTYRLPVGAAGMAIGIFGLFLLPGGLRFTGSAALFLAFLGWAAVGAIASPWQGVAFEAVLELGKVFMIYLVMVNAIRSRAQVWFFMVAFLALFGSHAVRGTLINYVTGNTYFGRAAWYQGIYGNANDMAALTLLQLSMAAALLMTQRRGLVKLGALFAMGALPFTILVTQSRAVLVALAVFLLFTVWSHPRKGRIIGAVLVLGTLVVAISPEGVWERLKGLRYATSTETLGQVDEEGSAAQRWAIWETGAEIIKNNAIVGTGLGTYHLANGSMSAALGNRDAHSTYITVAAENGVLGLVLFLLLVGATIARSWSVRRRLGRTIPDGSMQLRFLELGLVTFLIAGIWGSYSQLAYLYVHLALIWAAAAVCEREYAEAQRLVGHAPSPVRG